MDGLDAIPAGMASERALFTARACRFLVLVLVLALVLALLRGEGADGWTGLADWRRCAIPTERDDACMEEVASTDRLPAR